MISADYEHVLHWSFRVLPLLDLAHKKLKNLIQTRDYKCVYLALALVMAFLYALLMMQSVSNIDYREYV